MNVWSGVVLSPSELLLTSSPSHHSLDSVIDKVILEFVSNMHFVPFLIHAKPHSHSAPLRKNPADPFSA
jgi:hypothetical protein